MADSDVMSAPQNPSSTPSTPGTPGTPGENSPVSYRLRPALGVRMLGMACVWLALAVVLEALRRGVPAVDGALVVALEWIFFVLFVVVVALAAWSLLSRRAGLVLSDEGFVNRTNWRRDSVRSASWSQVADVRRSDGEAGPVFVVALADGRRSLIATRLLDAPIASLEEQLSGRLNTAHGYTPFQ